jgi:catechol-2,3-dioxygenase
MILRHIHLKTHDLQALYVFYQQVLEFEVKEQKDRFTLRAGTSLLTFSSTNDTSQPYYHFAFNIPYGQQAEALDWLENRLEVLSDEDSGNKMIDFRNWNAYALYFYDPAGNIVEFIARKETPALPKRAFDISAVLSVSEVGIPLQDARKAYQLLHEVCATPQYIGAGETFLPAGNAEGLLIMVDQQKKKWYPTLHPARSFPMEVLFEEEGQPFELSSSGGMLRVDQASGHLLFTTF